MWPCGHHVVFFLRSDENRYEAERRLLSQLMRNTGVRSPLVCRVWNATACGHRFRSRLDFHAKTRAMIVYRGRNRHPGGLCREMERDVSTPCLYTPSAKHLSSTTPAARQLPRPHPAPSNLCRGRKMGSLRISSREPTMKIHSRPRNRPRGPSNQGTARSYWFECLG